MNIPTKDGGAAHATAVPSGGNPVGDHKVLTRLYRKCKGVYTNRTDRLTPGTVSVRTLTARKRYKSGGFRAFCGRNSVGGTGNALGWHMAARTWPEGNLEKSDRERLTHGR